MIPVLVMSDELSEIWTRLKLAEARIKALEMRVEQDKVIEDLHRKQAFSYRFVATSDDYYAWTLQKRAAFLRCEVPQLCKTVLFENTGKNDLSTEDISDSKYYFVIVQYQSKIDVDLLRAMIIKLRGEDNKLAKKHFNFMLAPESISEKLTGFIHNGVCPFGLRDQSIPILICKSVLELSPPVVFVGGGHPQLKLCISTQDLSEAGKVFSSQISVPRSRLELVESVD